MLCIFVAPAAWASEGDGDVVFPLSTGSYWVYEGLVQWTRPGSNEATERAVTWKMEVVETFQREFLSAAAIKGFPADVAWYEDGKDRGDYLMVRIQDTGKLYLMGPDRTEEILQRLRNHTDPLINLVHESELIFDLPLYRGKRFGPSAQLTRSDTFYCWFVEGEERVNLTDVKGLTPGMTTQYRLALRSLPDHTFIDFVPGVGITRYIYYGHHGTLSEADLKLVEYHPRMD
jgi:hypothetical protein